MKIKEIMSYYERISEISKNQGFKSVNKFAKEGLGYASSEKINRLKDSSKKPSIDIILDISNKFEKINADWLLTGRGEMLISESTPHLSTDSIIDLTEYLFDHNETLMADPLFRKYIESNIITLEIEREKEKLEKMKAEIEERLNAMHSKTC